jgi:hypothetical protein
MNLLSIFNRFPNQEICPEYLEKLRWAASPAGPHGGKADGERMGRWLLETVLKFVVRNQSHPLGRNHHAATPRRDA